MSVQQQYYIRVRGAVTGPFDVERLKTLAKRGQFSRSYEVSTDGVAWSRASNHPELFPPPPATKILKKKAAEPPRRISSEAASSEAASGESAPGEPNSRQPPSSQTFSSPPLSSKRADQAAEPEFLLDGAYDLVEDDTPVADAAGPEWYFGQNSVECGPVSFAELQLLVSTGKVHAEDLVWTSDFPDWVAAKSVPGLCGAGQQPAAQSGARPGALPAVTPLELQQVVPMSVASLVLALLGVNAVYVLPLSLAKRAYALVGVGVLLVLASVLAVVFGHVALRQIKHGAGALSGGGMALGGLILGYFVMVAVTVVGIVLGFMLLLGGSAVP